MELLLLCLWRGVQNEWFGITMIWLQRYDLLQPLITCLDFDLVIGKISICRFCNNVYDSEILHKLQEVSDHDVIRFNLLNEEVTTMLNIVSTKKKSNLLVSAPSGYKKVETLDKHTLYIPDNYNSVFVQDDNNTKMRRFSFRK